MSDIIVLLESDPGPDRERRRVRGRSVGLVLAVAAAVVGAALMTGRDSAPPPDRRTAQPADQQTRPPGDVVASGLAGDERIVVLRRAADDGGQAVTVWAATGTGPYEQVSDYLSYDMGCLPGDPVCADLLRTGQGLGLFLLRDQPDGRSFLLVQAPAGRTVEVGGRAVGEAPGGTVVEVARGTPPPVWVTMPDGRRYRLPEMPGAVMTGL